MLGKLFKSKKAPQNNGDLITHSHISNLRLKKVFELELANMQGSPCYRLETKLGFGSEIGEILINDESISPRHCTFTLEQGVISIIDHNSLKGTLVNDVLIEAGKSIILDEADEIKIGELLINIKSYNEAVVKERKVGLAAIPTAATAPISQQDEGEELYTDSDLLSQLSELDGKFNDDTKLSTATTEKSGIDINELLQDETVSSIEVYEEEEMEEFLFDEPEEVVEGLDEEELPKEVRSKADKKRLDFKLLLERFRPKKKYGKSFRERSKNAVLVETYAANTILRIVALHIDLCFAYGTYLLVSPFDDFKDFTSKIIAQAQSLNNGILNTEIMKLFEKNASFVFEMFKDLWDVVDNYVNPIPTLIIFAISKIVFTLILGVSLGQFAVGMKASGSMIWKRLGGGLRTLIGFFTFPFLIFDIGAVISRRTFKEFITFTRIYSDSKVLNILLSIIFLAVSSVYVLMAPMFQGFESTTRYEIPAKLEERVKFGDNDIEIDSSFSSDYLKLKVEVSDEFEIYPGFRFEGVSNKTKSQFVLNIYDKKMQGSSRIELFKSFDFKQLLEIGFKGNPFLKIKFPHIDNFLQQHTAVGFKRSVLDSESFAQEFMEFHRMAMDMSIESYFDYIDEVPIIGSLLNYKESFVSLFEKAGLGSMSFVKVGNIFALRVSEINPKEHDYLIPILPEGKIYKISFAGETTSGISSRFYRYALYQSNWTGEQSKTAFDRIITNLREQKEIDINDAQALYGYYYELAQRVFTSINNGEYQLLRQVVKSVALLVSGVQNENSEVLYKLEANFKDLVDAVEIQNREYFNLPDSTIL